MTSRFLTALVPLLAASIVAADAGLAQASMEQQGDITVTGRREALTSMLKNVLEESDGQIGRFEERVCPGVSGLREDFAAVIVGVVRANAEAAGLRLEEEGCAPDAIAVFVSDPRALVRGWKEHQPSLFGRMSEEEVAALAGRSYPIVSWRIVETMGWDGVEPERVRTEDGSEMLQVRNARASRNSENVRQDIKLSLAVIDSKAIAGKSLQQLADIATLHLFLDVAPDAGEKAPSDSMLSLFEPRPAGTPLPVQLSAADRGMLGGLYRARTNNFDERDQRGRMVREIRREAGKTD